MPETSPIGPGVDERVMQILRTAVNEIGGLNLLARRHELHILPPLIESAYVLVLREEQNMGPAEIAEILGVSSGMVDAVFEAPTSDSTARIRQSAEQMAEFPSHTEPEESGQPPTGHLEPEYLAGALAKFAYSIVRRRQGKK